jgi:hypothetical protein
LIGKVLRDIVNLLIYGGALLAYARLVLQALSLSINSREDEFFMYSLWIGVCTAALYCGHRVIGLKKWLTIRSSERFNVIRKYERHIWIYFFIWILLSAILFFTFGSIRLVIWMLAGRFYCIWICIAFIIGQKEDCVI